MPPTPARLAQTRRSGIVLVTSVLLMSVFACPRAAAAETREEGPPNIIVIMTDDQRWDELRSMPWVRRHLQDRGITFTNAIVSYPLCCPSRAGFLSGEYPHTDGVWGNRGRRGGWEAFEEHENDTVATWLDGAGYQTGLFGKYLNQYVDGDHIPPGWDRWVAFVGRNARYFNYDLTIDGRVRSFGHTRSDYSTDVLIGYLETFIARAQPTAPIFALFAPFAPHAPGTPAPRDRHARVRVRFPHNRAMNERNVSDKPEWIRRRDPLTDVMMDRLEDQAIEEARSLLAVDDAIQRIVRAMAGRKNTMYVVLSDHGVSWGEHRWTFKTDPYEPTVRVPLVVRWDDHAVAGTRVGALVQNIDLAPTFAEVADVATPAIDGVSLVSLLDGRGTIRDHTLTEQARFRRGSKVRPPTYCVVRAKRHKLIRYSTGEEEFYVLARDPYETRNVLSTRRRTGRAFHELSSIADAECVLRVGTHATG